MSSVLVDTDVVSFLFKGHPIAKRYEADLTGRTLLISFMTAAELDRWAIQSNWGAGSLRVVEIVYRSIRNPTLQQAALQAVGGSHGGCAIARLPD